MQEYGDIPFDLSEEGKESLLLYEPGDEKREKIRKALQGEGYHLVEPRDEEEAVEHLRFQGCAVVLIGGRFGEGSLDDRPLFDYLRRLSSGVRRTLFIVLLSETMRTMDVMTAFRWSVNLVVNDENVGELPGILRRGRRENDELYAPFRESLRRAGKL